MISLSYSAATKYLTSARSYFLHYLLRLRPVEASSALLFGAAIDTGLNTLLETRDLALAKTKFLDAWTVGEINGTIHKLSNCNCIKYSKADYDDSFLEKSDYALLEDSHEAWVSLRRKGLLILDAYNVQVMPKIKEVLAVQKQIELPNELGDKLIGVVDLICVWEDGRRLLCDNKTSSVKYKDASADESEQLATYWEACRDEYKLDGVLYIVIPKSVRKKKEPKIEISFVSGNISDELIDQTFEKYDKALNGIKLGEFHCSGECAKAPWGCVYQKYCASEGKDLTGLTIIKK